METSATRRARQVLTLRDSIPADVAKIIAVSIFASFLLSGAGVMVGCWAGWEVNRRFFG